MLGGRRSNAQVLSLRTIETLDMPELAPYRTLRQQSDHYRERIFVVEGEKVVDRLLDSGLEIVSMLLPAEALESVRARIENRPERVTVFVADKRLLEGMTGFWMYQGFLACARIPEPTPLDVVLAQSLRPRFLVATEAVANSENLGGIVRSAAAFGAHGMIVGETCASPYLRRAVRSSMGAVFRLPMVEVVSLPETLMGLRRMGVTCVAAHPHADQRTLPEAVLTGDCCIVLGNEGDGLTDEVLGACDARVAVPMATGVDSLNVGAAGAVFFYEVWRQRNRNRD